MEGPGDLQRAVGFFSPDRSAKVKIWRDQAEKTVEVKVGQAPDERQAQQQQRPGSGALDVGSRCVRSRPRSPVS